MKDLKRPELTDRYCSGARMYRAELPLGPKLRWACACLAFIACVPASRPPADEPINAKCAMLTLPIKTISNAKMSSVFEHTELLLPVLAFAVPVLLVAMFTSLISSDAPKKKFPVHKRS